MSRLPKLFVRLIFALVVAGGLGVGARAAYAGTIPPDCSWNAPYHACSTAAECDAPCKAYFGEEAEGYCTSGCCICAV